MVDDEPGIVTLISMSLAEFDVEVVQASDLATAKSEAERSDPSVILLDIALGQEDGLDFLSERGISLRDIPVVVCSIHDSRATEALNRGAVSFLRKPFRRSELRAALSDYLEPAS